MNNSMCACREKDKSPEKVFTHPAVTRFPHPVVVNNNPMTKEEKITAIEEHIREIMEILELDLDDDSLAETPQRIARMYVNEVFSGLDIEAFPDVNFVEDKCGFSEQSNMVCIKAGFTSFCEHHFVPMVGVAYVAYIPQGRLIGLSKVPRIVRYFSQRPQLQERLTAQIADSMSLLLNIEDVAVSTTAKHCCVSARGIEDEQSVTTSQVLRGQFFDDEARQREFLESIKNQDLRVLEED